MVVTALQQPSLQLSTVPVFALWTPYRTVYGEIKRLRKRLDGVETRLGGVETKLDEVRRGTRRSLGASPRNEPT